jgi:hypothetical protein
LLRNCTRSELGDKSDHEGESRLHGADITPLRWRGETLFCARNF